MTGAVALAVVLVVAVAGISMAMESQRANGQTPVARRPPRPVQPTGPARRTRERMRKPPEAKTEPTLPTPPLADSEPEIKIPELLRTGIPVEARVISVVDERTIGPVTRSRLALHVEPEEGGPFEVTVRVAFPSPEARASVKVGGRIPVRYDKDDRTRVVVDLPQA